MAETISVSGFNVPAIPGAAQGAGASRAPATSAQTPGFVPPSPAAIAAADAVLTPPAATFTQADIDKAVAAALAKGAAPTAVVPSATVPLVDPMAALKAGAATYVNDGTGDAVLNSFTEVFLSVGAGLDMDRAFGKAMLYGNPALIDTAYISEKGGANAAQLQTIAKAIVERITTQTAASTSAIHATAGGKAQWDAASAAFNTNAPAHTKQVIAAMLNSGDPASIDAAAKSIIEFSRSAGLVPTHANLLHSGNAQNSGQALDKFEFQKLHSKLDPNSRTYQQDRAQLFERRTLGKQLGR
jgi:hypothetical protein